MRDLLYLQSEFDRRSAPRDAGEAKDQPGGGALLAAEVINQILPKRLRLTDIQILLRIDAHERIPKRELLKRVRSEWRALGRPRRRGATMPPTSQVAKFLNAAVTVFNEWRAKEAEA